MAEASGTGGKGRAHDATVITVDNTPEALEAALADARAAAEERFYDDQVERLARKVEKEKAALADSEAALAAAKAELAAREA